MLRTKTALVTGSTSGIGLGIAEALDAAGANVVLNGFGDAEEIEALRAGLAQRHGAEVRYDGADMMHALVASPYTSAYVAARHGIAGFTKAVALEVAEAGITVNAVCPGYVPTPLVQQQIPATAKARGISEDAVLRDVLLATQSTKRFVQVSAVAALTLHLCSDTAASITGAVLPVDGGWTAH